MLDYVFQLAQHQRKISGIGYVPDAIHLRWANEHHDTDSNNPATIILPHDVLTDLRISAFLLLLRSPESYDGSTDFMFEKYMKCVVDLLVDPQFVAFLR